MDALFSNNSFHALLKYVYGYHVFMLPKQLIEHEQKHTIVVPT